jgi:hypothetical protein
MALRVISGERVVNGYSCELQTLPADFTWPGKSLLGSRQLPTFENSSKLKT